MELKWWEKEKEICFLHFFIWFGRTTSFAYVLV